MVGDREHEVNGCLEATRVLEAVVGELVEDSGEALLEVLVVAEFENAEVVEGAAGVLDGENDERRRRGCREWSRREGRRGGERGRDEVEAGCDEDDPDAKEDEGLEEEEHRQAEDVEGERMLRCWTWGFQEPTTHAVVIRTVKKVDIEMSRIGLAPCSLCTHDWAFHLWSQIVHFIIMTRPILFNFSKPYYNGFPSHEKTINLK